MASCKSALKPPVVYSTDRSKAVVPVLVLLFGALWFILRGDLLYVLPCVILFLFFFFSVLLALRLPRLGKRELILVLFVCLIDLCLFGFVGFLFLLMSRKGCVCDCGPPWTFLLPFLQRINEIMYHEFIKIISLRDEHTVNTTSHRKSGVCMGINRFLRTTKIISFLSEKFAFLRHENFIKMNLRVFIFVYFLVP